MAYRPDGGTVLSAWWGCGSPLARAEVGGCGRSCHPLPSAPSPGGDPGFILQLIFSLIHEVFSGSGERTPSIQIPALPCPCCVTSGSGFPSLSSELESVH